MYKIAKILPIIAFFIHLQLPIALNAQNLSSDSLLFEIENFQKLDSIYHSEMDSLKVLLLDKIRQIEEKELFEDYKDRLKDKHHFKEENRRKGIFIIAISIFTLFIMVFALVFYRQKHNLVKLNYKLRNLGNDILEQAKELKEKNGQLIDSNEEISQQSEEIKAQAESLENALKQLRELNEFKEGLTAMIVHDLKNPLSVIFAASDNKMVLESGRKMLNMINNILDVHRFESTKMPVKKSEFNLCCLAKEAIEKVGSFVKQKSISVENKLDKNCLVYADNDLIERVFINLLSNATKYTPVNGRIEIGLLPESTDVIRVFVKDNGPGIPENLKNRVFDKFMQIIAKKAGETRSFGLGLTFCKMAIEAHGGIIGVDTKVGEGTSFWFTLPVKKGIASKIKTNNMHKAEVYNLDEESTEKLIPHIQKLKMLDVYEVSKIQLILSEIKELEIDCLNSWQMALENSVYTVNQQEFTDLLNLVK